MMAKVGRPTKYDPEIHPGIVRKLAAAGMTDEDMAGVLEIGVRTFYDWKESHPEFSQAVREGKAEPIKDVEDALYRLCKGYTYREGGEEKVKHPDVRAIQFYLKNVAPEKWRDKREVEIVDAIKVEVEYVNGDGKGTPKDSAR